MHQLSIAAVVIDTVRRNPLAKVGLEAVHAHVQQLPQLILIPFPGRRVGKVHQAHACLPHIPLPNVTIGPLEQVAVLHALFEQGGFLADVGVNPHADFQALFFQPLDKARGVLEHLGVKLEVAPLVLSHPVAVEVEHMQGDVPVLHAAHKLIDRLLVIVGGKGGGKPQAKGPGRGQGRLAGKGGVVLQHGLGVPATDDHKVQGLAGHRELGPGDHLRAQLITDLAAGIHKHAVALVGEIKGDVFIGNLRAGAPVLLPDVHHLAVLHKGGEPLAQTIDFLANGQIQLGPHKGALRGAQIAYHAVAELVAHLGEEPAVIIIGKAGRALGDFQLCLPAFHGDDARILPHFQGAVLGLQLKLRDLFGAAHKMPGLGADNVRLGRADVHLQHRAAHAPHILGIGHAVDVELIALHPGLPNLDAVRGGDTGLIDPITSGKLHVYAPSC